MFKIVNLAFAYYYFSAVALIVFPFIIIRPLLFNRPKTFVFDNISQYFLLLIPIIYLTFLLLLKYSFLFSGYLILFYFGSYFFYIYFRISNVRLNIKNILLTLSILTILEAVAVNTIINPSMLPNWPLSAEDTLLHGISRGGLIFDSFTYLRPLGFGGNSSITSSLLISLLLYLNRLKKDTFLISFLAMIAVISLYSGVGYILLSLYLLFFSRVKKISFLCLVTLYIYSYGSNIQKVDYVYYQYILLDIIGNLFDVVKSLDYVEIFSGQNRAIEHAIGGDFYWLYLFQWFGLFGVFFYVCIILLNSSKINFFPILFLVISTLHYHTIFAIPGQLIFGYLLSRKYP